MTIKLSLVSTDDGFLQRAGRKLSSALQSEIAAEAALQAILRQRKRAGWVAVLGACFVAGLVVAAAYGSPMPLGRWTSTVALSGMLVTVFGMAQWMATADDVKLYSPLASDENLCSQLMAMAERSQAVRTLIASINATGRQLRVFDVAAANAANSAELHRTSNNYAGSACAMLHSLTV